MSKIATYPTLTREECKDAIKAVGAGNKEAGIDPVTVLVMSEPGVGKSAILEDLRMEMGEDEYDFIYVDGPNKDMMDIAATIPNHETKSLEHYTASLFKMGNGKKKVIMIDEALKVPKLMQPIYTRLYQERTVGDEALPDGSMVFATTNNSSDGVGDNLQAHTANRVSIVRMSKPSFKEWAAWATDKGISPLITACCAMYPQVFRSYTEGDAQDNPYIFNPKRADQMSFVSPRSLHKCDGVIKKNLSYNMALGLLAGLVGESFARNLMSFVDLESKVTKFDDIIKDPDNAKMPAAGDSAPLLLMIFQAIEHIDSQDKLNKFQTFMNRVESHEIQSIWFVVLLRSKKAKMARLNPLVAKWAAENSHLL
jgi:hypothetical protein